MRDGAIDDNEQKGRNETNRERRSECVKKKIAKKK